MAADPIKLKYKITDPYKTTSNVTNIAIQKKFTNPVGQIVELGEKSEILNRFCSGFNINEGQYFLTAGHCIASAYAQSNLPVCFMYDGKSPLPNGKCAISFDNEASEIGFDSRRMYDVCVLENPVKIEEIVVHGYCEPAKVDYGVLKLASEAQNYGSLEFANFSPNLNSAIEIIHHPKQMSKRHSEGKLIGYNENGSRFVHNASTYGGSSGSPVLSHGLVIGVHVAGEEYQCGNKYIQKNQAVVIDKILDDAKKHNHYRFFHHSSSTNIIARNDGIVRLHPSLQPGGGCCN